MPLCLCASSSPLPRHACNPGLQFLHQFLNRRARQEFVKLGAVVFHHPGIVEHNVIDHPALLLFDQLVTKQQGFPLVGNRRLYQGIAADDGFVDLCDRLIRKKGQPLQKGIYFLQVDCFKKCAENVNKRFLLLRAYNYWDFPKGEVEPGEDALAAARRELAEEAGIVRLELPWGPDYYQTPPYGRGKVARYYLGRTATEAVQLGINPLLGRPEHHEYRWVSADQGLDLLGDRVAAALRWALGRIEE